MAEQPARKKAEIVEELRASGQQLLMQLRALPEKEFEQGRYENGWNGRQILAHVASIEWTYPRLLDLAKQGSADVRDAAQQSGSVATATAQGGIDAYNQRQVEKRANTSVKDLLAEFEQNRETFIAAVEATDESLLQTPIRSAGGVTGPLANVIYAVAVEHVLGHTNDIHGTS
ncbi:MAG: DinB family protein [Dehalococcoidia bacterium]